MKIVITPDCWEDGEDPHLKCEVEQRLFRDEIYSDQEQLDDHNGADVIVTRQMIMSDQRICRNAGNAALVLIGRFEGSGVILPENTYRTVGIKEALEVIDIIREQGRLADDQ